MKNTSKHANPRNYACPPHSTTISNLVLFCVVTQMALVMGLGAVLLLGDLQ